MTRDAGKGLPIEIQDESGIMKARCIRRSQMADAERAYQIYDGTKERTP